MQYKEKLTWYTFLYKIQNSKLINFFHIREGKWRKKGMLQWLVMIQTFNQKWKCCTSEIILGDRLYFLLKKLSKIGSLNEINCS